MCFVGDPPGIFLSCNLGKKTPAAGFESNQYAFRSDSGLVLDLGYPKLPPPVVKLSVDPAAVPAGSRTTINWSATFTTSCTASGGWAGPKGPSGSETTAAVSRGTTYTLTCSGLGGVSANTVKVTVLPRPTVSLSGPSQVQSGSSANIRWSSTNASTCTASGDWSGSLATSGSWNTPALTHSTKYVLTCRGAGGETENALAVTVIPPPEPPRPTTGTVTALFYIEVPSTLTPCGTTSLFLDDGRRQDVNGSGTSAKGLGYLPRCYYQATWSSVPAGSHNVAANYGQTYRSSFTIVGNESKTVSFGPAY